MPMPLAAGPFALALLFYDGTLTMHLALRFPTFSAVVRMDMVILPLAVPPRVALYLGWGDWRQIGFVQTGRRWATGRWYTCRLHTIQLHLNKLPSALTGNSILPFVM